MSARVGQSGRRAGVLATSILAATLLLGACGGGDGTEVAADGESASGGTASEERTDDSTGGGLGALIDGVEVTTTTTAAPETTTTTAAPVYVPPTTRPPVATTAPPVYVPPVTATVPLGPPPTLAPTNPAPVTATDLSADERRILDGTNAWLASQGRPGLTPAADLMTGARMERDKMIAAHGPVSPSLYTGTTRTWSLLQGSNFHSSSLETVIGAATSGGVLTGVPAGATHIGIGVGTDGSQAYVSLRWAVA